MRAKHGGWSLVMVVSKEGDYSLYIYLYIYQSIDMHTYGPLPMRTLNTNGLKTMWLDSITSKKKRKTIPYVNMILPSTTNK